MVFPWIPAVGDHPHVVRDRGVLEFVGEHDCQRLVTSGLGPTGRILRGQVCCRPADDDGSASVYRKISFIMLCGAMMLQALTLTRSAWRSRQQGWIGIKNVFTIRPAEIVKLALCVWMPCELIRARKRLRKEVSSRRSGSWAWDIC